VRRLPETKRSAHSSLSRPSSRPSGTTSLHAASFVLSVAELNQLPPDRGVEVAVAGRSNAGKSSAINTICARRKLAFVSRTPGRTQLINFFDLGGGRHLVDLPGYGYAKVPAAVRMRWEALLGAYLQTRRALQGLLLVMDVRHPLTALDQRMLEWFSVTGRPVHVLLTKADKLSRQAAERQRIDTMDTLARRYPGTSVQLFSSTTSLGLDEAQEALTCLLAGLAPAQGRGEE